MDLKVFEYSREPWTAYTTASVLKSAGLHPVIFDSQLVRMDWFLSQAVGGVRVMVPLEESKNAQEILDNPIEIAEETQAEGFIHAGRMVTAIIAFIVTQRLCPIGLMALI